MTFQYTFIIIVAFFGLAASSTDPSENEDDVDSGKKDETTCSWTDVENTAGMQIEGIRIKGPVFSLEDCKARCCAIPGCVAADWVLPQCYVFTRLTRTTSFAGRIYSSKRCKTTCPWRDEENTAGIQNEATGSKSPVLTLEDCKARCCAVSGCVAVDWAVKHCNIYTRLTATTAFANRTYSTKRCANSRQPDSEAVRAIFSYGGIKATVTFSQKHSDAAVILSTEGNLTDNYLLAKLQLHTFPVQYDVEDRCRSETLGPRLEPEGNIPERMSFTARNSIEGRSMALLNPDDSILSCATIERSGNYITARAIFQKGILGVILFRQHESSATSLTRVITDLFFDGWQNSSTSLEWRVSETEDQCLTVTGAFSPNGSTDDCGENSQKSCAIGDLTGKLGNILIGTAKGMGRTTTVDLNLPLTGSSSILGKTVQLFVQGDLAPRACAVITQFLERSGVANFNHVGITGSLTFTQRSPLDPTVTHISLTNLRALVAEYHVHEWPVPQHTHADQQLCSPASVSGHFNPFGVVYDVDTPPPGEETEDQYEVADLSRKYGTLNSLDAINETYTDYNLPLFGVHSILGRSVVLHSVHTGDRLACSNIRDTEDSIYALATFKFPVIGYALFHQRKGDFQETTIYIQLDFADGAREISKNHSWAIHENSISKDWLNDEVNDRCLSCGGIFDPFSVNSSEYAVQCGPQNPICCRAGDLGAKHGHLSIGANGGEPIRAFFTDVSLSLRGPNSILGKSIVLLKGDGSGQRMACADIIALRPRRTEVVNWGDANDHSTVFFTQKAWIINEPTSVDLKIKLFPQGKIEYSIAELPASQHSSNRCENLSDMFNPFNLTSSAPGGTQDQKKVGDLSGKLGSPSSSCGCLEGLDFNLNLFGPLSVVGRVFIERLPQEAKLRCGVIMDSDVDGGVQVSATALFSGDFIGYIQLKQYVYPDETTSHTTVIIDLKKSDGQQGMLHNWYVSQNLADDDVTATAEKCSSTGDLYNPFMVNVTFNYDDCNPLNPLRCQLGDLSGRLGALDLGHGVKVITDINLPLVGEFTGITGYTVYGFFGDHFLTKKVNDLGQCLDIKVLGRSVLIQKENDGSPIACATILPTMDTAASYDLNLEDAGNLNISQLAEDLARALNTARHKLVLEILHNASSNFLYQCRALRIHFIGLQGEDLKEKLSVIHARDFNSIGNYKTCSTVCQLERSGKLIQFNKNKMRIRQPCNYRLVTMSCGQYNMVVTGRSTLNNKFRFSPFYLLVEVNSTQSETIAWSGEITSYDLQKYLASPEGTLLARTDSLPWTTLNAFNQTQELVWFDPLQQAAVVSDRPNTFRVQFNHRRRKTLVEIGCNAAVQSEDYPQYYPEDSSRDLCKRRGLLQLGRTRQVVLKDILLDNSLPQTKECMVLQRTFSECSPKNHARAVESCEMFLSYPKLLAALRGDYFGWFNDCLLACCTRSAERCRLLKSKLIGQLQTSDRILSLRNRIHRRLDCENDYFV